MMYDTPFQVLICSQDWDESIFFSQIGVCYLRLDFESFDINGLSDSVEQSGTDKTGTTTECQDKFTISVQRDFIIYRVFLPYFIIKIY